MKSRDTVVVSLAFAFCIFCSSYLALIVFNVLSTMPSPFTALDWIIRIIGVALLTTLLLFVCSSYVLLIRFWWTVLRERRVVLPSLSSSHMHGRTGIARQKAIRRRLSSDSFKRLNNWYDTDGPTSF